MSFRRSLGVRWVFLAGVVRRSAIAWVGIHGIVVIILLYLRWETSIIAALARQPRKEVLGMLVLSSGIAFIETRRRHEHLLLGNIGVSVRELVGWTFVPPVILECLLRLTLGS